MISNSFLNKFSDKKIKLLIIKYQKYPYEPKIYEKILIMISVYVYNYGRRYKLSVDQCSSFYLYFFERFSKLLLKNYQIQQSLFISWLNQVLKTSFLNWIKKKSVLLETEYHKMTLICDDIEKYSLKDESNKDFIFLSDNKIRVWLAKDIQNFILKMPEKLKYIIKLLCPDLIVVKDFKQIGKIFNLSIEQVFIGYKYLLKSNLAKYRKKYDALENLLKIDSYIHKYESFLSKVENSFNGSKKKENKTLYQKYQLKLDYLKSRKQKKIYEYHRIKIQSKIRDIAFVLNDDYQRVKNLIHRAKMSLKRIIKDDTHV